MTEQTEKTEQANPAEHEWPDDVKTVTVNFRGKQYVVPAEVEDRDMRFTHAWNANDIEGAATFFLGAKQGRKFIADGNVTIRRWNEFFEKVAEATGGNS